MRAVGVHVVERAEHSGGGVVTPADGRRQWPSRRASASASNAMSKQTSRRMCLVTLVINAALVRVACSRRPSRYVAELPQTARDRGKTGGSAAL